MPLMRPLIFEEPENPKTYTMNDPYLWGEQFLISPVTAPGKRKKKVYFPSGSNWYDFYSGQKHAGGQSDRISLPPDHIPVFVRGGAFVPMTEPVQSTAYYSTDEIHLHYYYDPDVEKSGYTLYDDDGSTPQAYEKGRYERIEMESLSSDSSLQIRIVSSAGKEYTPKSRVIQLQVHHFPSRPGSLILNGKEGEFNWDEGKGILEFKLDLPGHGSADVLIR